MTLCVLAQLIFVEVPRTDLQVGAEKPTNPNEFPTTSNSSGVFCLTFIVVVFNLSIYIAQTL